MCNLYGFYKKESFNKEIVSEGPKLIPDTEILKLRGRDSFGFAHIWMDNRITKIVADKPTLNFVGTDFKYFAFESRAIPEPELIEHAKSGLHPNRDTQPFYNDEWVTSHNGTIRSPEKIIKEWDLGGVKSPVDSAILPELFKVCNPIRALKYHINGSFAIAAYRRYEHALTLLATFQPLYYVDDDNYVYYASIKEQLEYLNKPIQKVEPYTGITFTNGTKTISSLYRNEINNKVLVVMSGGLDSVTTARLYQVLGYEVSCVHFKYDQAAETVEEKLVKKICKYYAYPLTIINMQEVFHQCSAKSTLITHTQVQNVVDDAEGTPSYVGNRNMIFSSIAAGIAEERGIGRVVLGLNLSDGSGYPDNSLPYLLNMEETLKTSLNQQERVLYRSPFVNLMKREILQIAIVIGSCLPWQASCYFPELDEHDNPIYCTGCGSHLLRALAFNALKLKDPIKYKDKYVNFNNCQELDDQFYHRMKNKELRLQLAEIPFGEIIKLNL